MAAFQSSMTSRMMFAYRSWDSQSGGCGPRPYSAYVSLEVDSPGLSSSSAILQVWPPFARCPPGPE